MTEEFSDAIDQLCAQWAEESPELDTSAMQIIGRIVRLGNRFVVDANHVLKGHGLKYSEFDIIATLRRSGKPYKLTPTQLCESVVLTSGAMTTALDRLEHRGLIIRAQDEADKRIKSACLTDEGVSLAKSAALDRFDLALQELGSLSQQEKHQLTQLLKKLR